MIFQGGPVVSKFILDGTYVAVSNSNSYLITQLPVKINGKLSKLQCFFILSHGILQRGHIGVVVGHSFFITQLNKDSYPQVILLCFRKFNLQ